jgi:hypothetical protein
LNAPCLTPAEVNALSALFTREASVVGLADALGTSLNRAAGAFQAGNLSAETLQRQTADQYAQQLASALSGEAALRQNVAAALQAGTCGSKAITTAAVSAFESKVSASGLPSWLIAKLQQVGADSTTIAQVQQLVIAQDINAVAGTYPAKLADPSLLTALQQEPSVLRVDTNPATLHSVAGQVKVKLGRLRRGRHHLFQQTVTLRNVSGRPIDSPLVLLLGGLSRRIKLLNGTGFGGRGHRPFLAIKGLGANNVLAPGGSVTVALRFSGPASASAHFHPFIMAGIGTP